MADKQTMNQLFPNDRFLQSVDGQEMAHDLTSDAIVAEMVRRLPTAPKDRSYSFEQLKTIAHFAAGVGLRCQEQPAPLEYKVLFGAEMVMGEAFYEGLDQPTLILTEEQ